MMNRHVMRRALVLLLALVLALPPCPQAQSAASAVFCVSGAKDLQEPSVLDLNQAWEAIQVPDSRFDETPSAVYPYRLGKLSEAFLQQNLETLNFFRLSANLPAVQYTDTDNTDAQYGAVVLAAANELVHSPPRSANMGSDFYQRGCSALSASNISAVNLGGRDAAEVERNKLHAAVPMIMRNYMDGYGSANRASVPHRRWMLYPALQSVGIGCADAADSAMYQVLKVIGTQSTGAKQPAYDFLAWPASGNFPTQAISPDVPWSITLNPEVFRTPDRSSLTINVTRQSDGKSWTFNAASSADSGSQTFFLVNTQNYGVDNCILFAFRSGQTDGYSGDYRVTVTGLRTRDGREAMLDYQMHFVDVENCVHDWTAWITDTPPTCTESGLQYRLCRNCGEREEEPIPPVGHVWEISMQIQKSDKYHNGSAEFTCALCGAQKQDALPLSVCRDKDCPSARFTDTPDRNNWAHNGIDFVLENGIFNGTGATTFSPKGKMTRAMLVTVLWRIAGQPESEKPYTFTDVDGAAYYAPAVRWASENGVVQGYSPQRFGPSNDLTREQAVTLLQRFFAPDAEGRGDISTFKDVEQVDGYARMPMAWAVENGVITGAADADGELCLLPDNSITREQTASVIMRCLMNLDAGE